MQRSVTNIFDHYKLFSTVMYFMAAIYYFRRRLYITFDGFSFSFITLALLDCDFIRLQDFITIFRTYGLKARLDFNINLLALIKFGFFCSSVVSSISFDAPF